VFRDSLVKQPISTFILPDDQDIFYMHRKLLNETAAPQECELRILKNDGMSFWTRIDGIRSHDKTGDSVCRFVITDISERKKAEQLLQESEEKYRILSEYSTDGISLFENNIVKYISNGYSKMLGYDKNEIENITFETIFSFLHEDDAQEIQEKIETAHFQKTEKFLYRYRVKKKTGEYIWVEDSVNAEYDSNGNHFRSIIHSRDITERKHQEKILYESEEKYRLLASNIPDIIYSLDGVGNIVAINSLAFEHYGYTEHEVMGKPFLNFVHPDDREILINSFLQAIKDNRKVTTGLQFRIVGENGTIYWFELNARARFDSHNCYIGEDGVLRDITERKLAEDKINSLFAEKELILKEVNHRIKNNMNVIYALLFLKADTMKDPSAIAALEDSASRVQSMMVLYDKLYRSPDFQKISVIDYIPSLVDEIVANFPNSKSVKIEKKIDNFVLHAKQLQPLGIIINEILTNIMKYAFKGRDDGKISVTASVKDGQAVFEIQDNGSGIPESVDFENSTGFGLQLVWMLTKDLHGTIRIERGNGTKIILKFEI
jgi:PAS domain S-box-containing protein